MRSTLSGIEARYADVIAAAVLDELRAYEVDDARVELTAHAEPGVSGVLSVGLVIDGACSKPMLIETEHFKESLEAQMDLLRAWLGAGHPTQISSAPTVRYRAGERVPAPDASEPVMAVRDSQNNRVWVVSERALKDPSAEPIPYLIFPDGSLFRERQHGLPD